MTDSSPDPADWARVKALFERVAELAPEERDAFLRDAVGDEPEVLARVQAMLEADAEAEGFLEDSPAVAGFVEDPPSADRWAGRRFGPYEVVREIGRGGMGVVLLARRADGRYEREVALKVVPATLVQGHAADRFRSEVRILGGLDHPNVARLLDAGETEEGLAYLVMEYVDGARLDVFADERALDVESRLRLFLSVLEGTAYAHGRGIIHRDLKPSNILVGDDGLPKLVDFGIAKLLDPDPGLPDAGAVTGTAQRVLTPEYASPEQVSGAVLDERTDVYSLGVVLYRLLTGRRPYRLDSTTPRDAERAILESNPSRPSDAVTRGEGVDPETTLPTSEALARMRSSTRDRLRRSLRGDLDAIVLCALSKDPARRYPTVRAFAEDIERHLDRRPIQAREPSAAYRTARAVRRRWVPIAAGTAAFLAVAAVSWQAREARLQRQAAEASGAELTGLVDAVLSTLNTDLSGQDQGPTAIRAAAVEAAVASLDSLAARQSGPPPPGLLRALAGAYQEVAVIQGHPTSSNLGRIDDATAGFEQSLALWEQLIDLDEDDIDARFERIETLVLLSDTHRARGDNPLTRRLLDEAEASLDSIAGRAPTEVMEVSTRAMVYERQAIQADGAADFESAARYIADLTDLAIRSAELTPEGPQKVGALEEVVLAYQYESFIAGKMGDDDLAIATQRRAAEFADSLAALPATTQRLEGIRSHAWNQLGWRYNDADRPEEADAAFTRALDLMQAMAAEDPRNQAIQASLGQLFEGRGQARIRGERWEDALEDQTEAIEILTPLLDDMPATAFVVAQAHRERGEAHTRLGNYETAAEEYDRGIAMAEELLALDPNFAPARKILALARFSRALHYRLRVAATGDEGLCAQALSEEAAGNGAWTELREAGLNAASEEAIWADFEDMMPDVCPGPQGGAGPA